MLDLFQGAITLTKTLRTPEHIFLCERLKQARLQASLTQADLAKRLGKPQSYVAKVETQERRLDVVELARWMIACGDTDFAQQTFMDLLNML